MKKSRRITPGADFRPSSASRCNRGPGWEIDRAIAAIERGLPDFREVRADPGHVPVFAHHRFEHLVMIIAGSELGGIGVFAVVPGVGSPTCVMIAILRATISSKTGLYWENPNAAAHDHRAGAAWNFTSRLPML